MWSVRYTKCLVVAYGDGMPLTLQWLLMGIPDNLTILHYVGYMTLLFQQVVIDSANKTTYLSTTYTMIMCSYPKVSPKHIHYTVSSNQIHCRVSNNKDYV